jgi:hypothetical protein
VAERRDVCAVDIDGKPREIVGGLRLVTEIMLEFGLDPQRCQLGAVRAGVVSVVSVDSKLRVETGDAFRTLPLLFYVPSQKHKLEPTRGVKGAICPPGVDAQALLEASEMHSSKPGKRFATDGQHCYTAHEDARGGWHGWPCTRQQVPEQIWRRWVRDGKLARRRAN